MFVGLDKLLALIALQQQEGFCFGDDAEFGKIIGLDAALANDTSTGKERDILISFTVVKLLAKMCAGEEGVSRLAI
jgi:hypothetical protein